jgi:hypothetical protein
MAVYEAEAPIDFLESQIRLRFHSDKDMVVVVKDTECQDLNSAEISPFIDIIPHMILAGVIQEPTILEYTACAVVDSGFLDFQSGCAHIEIPVRW